MNTFSKVIPLLIIGLTVASVAYVTGTTVGQNQAASVYAITATKSATSTQIVSMPNDKPVYSFRSWCESRGGAWSAFIGPDGKHYERCDGYREVTFLPPKDMKTVMFYGPSVELNGLVNRLVTSGK